MKLEEEKAQKVQSALIGYSENQQKIKAKMATVKSEEEKANRQKMREYKAKEERIQKQHDQMIDERQMKAMEKRLARERKQMAVKRAERKKEFQKLQLKQQFDRRVQSIENAQTEKQKWRKEQQKRRNQIEQENAWLKSEMAQIKLMDDRKRPAAMQQLAQQYGISIEELKQRATTRNEESMRSSYSHLPPLNKNNNQQNSQDDEMQNASQSARVTAPEGSNSDEENEKSNLPPLNAMAANLM